LSAVLRPRLLRRFVPRFESIHADMAAELTFASSGKYGDRSHPRDVAVDLVRHRVPSGFRFLQRGAIENDAQARCEQAPPGRKPHGVIFEPVAGRPEWHSRSFGASAPT
jgi:hypothetical protein